MLASTVELPPSSSLPPSSTSSSPPLSFPSTSSFRSKINRYWRCVHQDQKRVKQAVISDVSVSLPADIRPHATVAIEGIHMLGLLDSGASISCLGRNAMQRIEQLGLTMKPINQSVHTADGSSQSVLGFVEPKVSFKDRVEKIRLFVIPSLTQELYLGVDFWRKFELAPDIIGELTSSTNIPPRPADSIALSSHELSEGQQVLLDSVRSEFLSSEDVGLGKTPLLQHRIDTGSSVPIKQRYYTVSPAIQTILNEEADAMLARGVIEESQSPWSSPVLVVRKPDGKRRFCLDCRAVNKVTIKDAYPMPIIDGILASLHETVFISSVDLKDAFWQIELTQDSREKTAFTIPGRPLYHFVRMPFGLCNAPQTMCRLMDKVIPNELKEYVFVYIDDLLVVSKTFEDHVSRLRAVAKCLREANLTINVKKSKFCMKEIRYLGHVVGNGCIKADPGKVEAITKFPVPRTVRQVRSFLGMCGWYQRYISGFASIAAPITNLLAKHERFVWTDEAQEGFEKLKSCLTSAPVLRHPDFTKPFVIQCDASQSGVGGVLYQVDDEGDEHPIAYMSKKLNGAQRNYSVTEQECLAAILCIKKFRGYVEGMTFKVVTDHASLKWLMTQKDLTGRLARWSLKLQAFDFSIEHRRGSENVVPDALSRVHVDELTLPENDSPLNLDDVAFDSVPYLEMRNRIESQANRLPDLRVRGKHIFIRTRQRPGYPTVDSDCWRLWVPQGLTSLAITNAHCPPLASHPGVAKTLEKLRRSFYWPKMAVQVTTFVQACKTCKETKAPNVTLRPPMGDQVFVERPWQRLYIDLLGPYPRSKSGNTTLLIVLDHFSKFVLLKPIRKATAAEIVGFLEKEVFHVYGVPETIWSDNGVQFVSRDFQSLLGRYGVSHIRTASHSPQSNASERVNRSILAAIRSYITDNQQNWDAEISSISSALRNNVHESTGYSPHYLVFGQYFVNHGSCYKLLRELQALPEDEIQVLAPPDFKLLVGEKVRENLNRAYDRHEKAYNTRCRAVSFEPGQEIYRRNFQLSKFSDGVNAKLNKQWLKARVVNRIGNSLYELEDMAGKPLKLRYHAKDLKQ